MSCSLKSTTLGTFRIKVEFDRRVFDDLSIFELKKNVCLAEFTESFFGRDAASVFGEPLYRF